MSNIIINENRDNILKVIANDFAISRNAKGMMLDLLFMNSNASIKALVERSTDGQHKVATALKELEKNGYLVRQRIRTSGKWSDYNYVLTIPQVEETMFVRETTSKTKDLFLESLDTPILNAVNPIVENRNMVKPKAESLSMDDFDIEESPYTENRDAVDDNIYTSIYNQDIDMIDNNISNNINRYDISNQSSNLSSVKSQIGYQSLINETNEDDKDLIDMMVDIISEIYHLKNPWTRVSGRSMPTRKVVTQLMKLNESDMLYIIDCINSTNTTIRSIKPYLITSLYNAAMTQDSRKMSGRFNKRKNKKKQAEKDCNANSTISMDLYYQTVDLIDKELYALGDACYA